MKILYGWLKEFVDLDIPPEGLAEKLENLGIEVASLNPLSKGLANVVVGEILESKAHPNADRLSVCTVFDGREKRQIVCGAKNFKVGDKAPLALPGASLPNGAQIAAAKLRGVESQGMLCSETELGFPKFGGDGIMILEKEAVAGTPLAAFLNWDETLLEIEITPNRGDLLSHLGLARELSAAWRKPLRLPTVPAIQGGTGSFPVRIEVPEKCARYTARVLEGAKVGPSPRLMSLRLSACGIRPISNAVDVTNYVLLETGQPLHVFDLDKLNGKNILVRWARSGEKLLALDGNDYKLTPEMLVIADSAGPVALAGVMGGESSAVGPETKNILLESASFDPVSVRRTSRKLGLSSESSYRFERGVDPEGVLFASRRAGALLQEISGSTQTAFHDENVRPWKQPAIALDSKRVNRRLGTSLSDTEMAELLSPLGPVQKRGETLVFSAPSHRQDLLEEHDLMEEVARFHGYDRIPSTCPPMPILEKTSDPLWALERKLSDILTGFGFFEAAHYSFLSDAAAQKFGFEPKSLVSAEKPLSAEWTHLRPSLVPGLSEALSRNARRQRPGVRLFELGKIFQQSASEPVERPVLGLALFGPAHEPDWLEKPPNADVHTLTGLAQTFLDILKISAHTAAPANPLFWDPKASWEYRLGENVLGVVGRLRPDLEESLDLPAPALFLEWDLGVLAQTGLPQKRAKPVSAFPSVNRDLSVVVSRSIPWNQLEGAIRQAGGEWLEDVRLFDVYRGKGLAQDQQSLAFALRFRSQRETLTDKAVEKLQENIVKTLQETFSASLRSS